MSVVCEDVRYKYHIIVCILLKFLEEMYISNYTSHSASRLLLLSSFFVLNNFIYLFINVFDSAGSSLLHWLFSNCGGRGLLSSCGGASHCVSSLLQGTALCKLQ